MDNKQIKLTNLEDNTEYIPDTQEIKVKYMDPDAKELKLIGNKSDWVDLRAAKQVKLKAGEAANIPLGIAMMLPDGCEAHIAPRSSTFKNWGILQTNSVGVVDSSYCGDNDEWAMPVYATRDTVIEKGDRICQFRVMEKQPTLVFKKVDKLDAPDRGGFGSTGKN